MQNLLSLLRQAERDAAERRQRLCYERRQAEQLTRRMSIAVTGDTHATQVLAAPMQHRCKRHTAHTGAGDTQLLQVQAIHSSYRCRRHVCSPYVAGYTLLTSSGRKRLSFHRGTAYACWSIYLLITPITKLFITNLIWFFNLFQFSSVDILSWN